MSIVYRLEKGAPLTLEELDGNFRELDMKLKLLEDHPDSGESLAKVELQDDLLVFTGSFGMDLGRVPLPKASLIFQGLWEPLKSYKCMDLVTREEGLYYCLETHMSAEWNQDQDKWKIALSMPKPVPTSLHLYEKATLPQQASLGKFALLMDEESPILIFFNGKAWQKIVNGEHL